MSEKKTKNTSMKIDDEIRLKILDALTDGEGAKPNIDYIAKKTGFSRRTIYNSLEYLKNAGVFSELRPVIDKSRLNFNITKVCLLNIDLDKVSDIEKMKKNMLKDPRIYWFSDIIASDVYNFCCMCIYRSIDESHHLSNDCCNRGDIVKTKQFFYIDTGSDHVHKNISPAKCAIKLLLEEKERH